MQSTFTIWPPRDATWRAASSKKTRLGAPFHFGSVFGKKVPMSPAPSANVLQGPWDGESARLRGIIGGPPQTGAHHTRFPQSSYGNYIGRPFRNEQESTQSLKTVRETPVEIEGKIPLIERGGYGRMEPHGCVRCNWVQCDDLRTPAGLRSPAGVNVWAPRAKRGCHTPVEWAHHGPQTTQKPYRHVGLALHLTNPLPATPTRDALRVSPTFTNHC